MPIYLATKTVESIERAIVADNGNRFRQLEGEVLPWMRDAYRDDEDTYRTHLGASVMGHKCDRALYYQWHWAIHKQPTGWRGEGATAAHARMIRLWNRGNIEEGRFIAMLVLIGVTVYTHDPETGKQFRMEDFGGHFAGSCDGIGVGIPDLPPGMPALLEFKTHGSKYFRVLKMDGVCKSNFSHYVQMQIYMRRFGLQVALYLAVDKDTDQLYAELVPYDETVSAAYSQRAGHIIFTQVLPPRIPRASPGYTTCRFCDMANVCFGAKKAARNCRTCANVRIAVDGKFYCGLDNRTLGKAAQQAGCEKYTISHMLQ